MCMFDWAGRVVAGGSGTADYFSNFQEGLLVLEMGGQKDVSLPWKQTAFLVRLIV